MSEFTLHDLQCFDAVLRNGGFQAAAVELHRSHPSVFAAVAKLERQLGLTLLDRSGYRVTATAAGRSLHGRAQSLLNESTALRTHAQQLAMGEESELCVVIGDLCPLAQTLNLLSGFFAENRTTRLNLFFEAVSGPWERLFDDEADLIVHRIDKTDARVEWIDLARIQIVPVAAPDFLGFPVSRALRPERLRDFMQCVIRDTARHSPPDDHFLVDGAPQCTVADHAMKKEIILQGMGWGHLPRFMAESELRSGKLISLAGRYLPGRTEELCVARRRDRPHGPVAERLWCYLAENAARLKPVGNKPVGNKSVDKKPAGKIAPAAGRVQPKK